MTTNEKMALIQETTEEFQKKMLKALGDIPAVLIGLRTDMTAMKDMVGSAENEKAATDNKKHQRIMDTEEILTKCLPGFREYFNKVTFCASVLSQMVRALSVILKPPKIQLEALKMLMEMMMFSKNSGSPPVTQMLESRQGVSAFVS